MKNTLAFITAITTALSIAGTRWMNLPRFSYGMSYNQIPHKHRKHRRGKPK